MTWAAVWIRCWRRAWRGCRGGRRGVLLDIGGVFVDGRRVKMAGRPMRKGEEVVAVMGGALARATQKTGRAARGADERTLPAFAVVFEDDDIVVVDKPSGLLTAPTPESDRNNLADLLSRRPGAGPVFVVHRIDLETSGLVVFAKTADANRELSHRFRDHDLERAYLAVGRRALPRRDEADRSARRRAPRRHARGDPGTVRRPGDAGGVPAGDGTDAPDPAAHGRGRNTGNRRRALRASVRAGAAPDGAARDQAGPRSPADRRAAVVREPLARRSGKVAHRNNVAQQR